MKRIKQLKSLLHPVGRYFAAPIASVVAFTRSASGSPIRLAALSFAFMLAAAVVSVQAQSTVVYVDINNGDDNPPNFGQQGWGANAHRYLQDALDAANTIILQQIAEEVDIWVAAGVYKPDHDSSNPDGTCDEFGEFMECTGTAATFTIPSNVRIFGGFVGTESSLDGRNSGVHDPTLTILTGDLADGAGDPDFPVWSHSANVVTFANTDSTARLDTVTIKRGYNVTVSFNNSSAILSNAIITKSVHTGARVPGQGIPRFMNCQFIDNQGVGQLDSSSALTIQLGAHATVVNSLFYNNRSFEEGAAVRVLGVGAGNCPDPPCPDTSVTLINCTIVKNIASSSGGGIYRTGEGTSHVKNCIFWENEDSSGTSESAQIHHDTGGGDCRHILNNSESERVRRAG